MIDRRRERGTKEIHKFLAEHVTEDMSMDDINALLSKHINEINARIPEEITEETADCADDFMDLAEDKLDDGDLQGAIRLARKALKLEPDNLDAEWFLIQHEEKEPESLLRRMQLALERGKNSLEEKGFFEKENIGEFWQMIETRPYMRLMNEYITALTEFGMLKTAVRESEEMMRLNAQDNLGLRFSLMHLYAMLEDAEAAENLKAKFSEHDEGPMLLALTLLYYKLGETDKAEKTLRSLTRINKETRAFVRDVLSDKTDRIMSAVEKRGGYTPFSEEELVMALSENENAYQSAPLFFRWMAKTLKI